MGERGDRFARWFVALTQFVPAETGSSNEITVWCDPQGRKFIDGVETPKVTISRDDPRFDESDLDATMFRLCALM